MDFLFYMLQIIIYTHFFKLFKFEIKSRLKYVIV